MKIAVGLIVGVEPREEELFRRDIKFGDGGAFFGFGGVIRLPLLQLPVEGCDCAVL